MPKLALVTGGAGFIGSHMADALVSQGFEVVVVDNLSTGVRENVPAAARFVQADVTDHDALAPAFDPAPDVVVHIAGQASNIKSFHDPESDLRVNVTGTLQVLRHTVRTRVPRLLFASSMMVYGNEARVPTPETEACRPTSYYGISKLAAERFVHATALRPDLAAPLAVTSFRMFNVYGERQSVANPYQGVLAIFVGNVLRDEPLTIHSDGRQSRDFVHIDDVVRAWTAAIDDPATHGEVFNVGEGIGRSINELADVVIAAAGRDPKTYPLRREPERPGDHRRSVADTCKAERMLAWQRQVPFDQGIRRVFAWAAASRKTGPTASR